MLKSLIINNSKASRIDLSCATIHITAAVSYSSLYRKSGKKSLFSPHWSHRHGVWTNWKSENFLPKTRFYGVAWQRNTRANRVRVVSKQKRKEKAWGQLGLGVVVGVASGPPQPCSVHLHISLILSHSFSSTFQSSYTPTDRYRRECVLPTRFLRSSVAANEIEPEEPKNWAQNTATIFFFSFKFDIFFFNFFIQKLYALEICLSLHCSHFWFLQLYQNSNSTRSLMWTDGDFIGLIIFSQIVTKISEAYHILFYFELITIDYKSLRLIAYLGKMG